jgi:hypothetical protein
MTEAKSRAKTNDDDAREVMRSASRLALAAACCLCAVCLLAAAIIVAAAVRSRQDPGRIGDRGAHQDIERP